MKTAPLITDLQKAVKRKPRYMLRRHASTRRYFLSSCENARYADRCHWAIAEELRERKTTEQQINNYYR